MAKNQYTSLDPIIQDFQAYVRLRQGQPLTLADIPIIAVNRWTSFFLPNWDIQIRPLLKKRLVGDDVALSIVKSLGDDVLTQKLSTTSPLNPFLNQGKLRVYRVVIDQIRLTELTLSPAEQAQIRSEQDRILQLTVTDFEQMSQFVRKEACLITQAVGLGDEDGVEVQGFPITQEQRSFFISDLEEILTLRDLADEIEGVIFDLKQRVDLAPDLLTLANQHIASDSDVTVIQTYQSSIAVPFRGTLEQMAKDFLGSADRKFELITVNHLLPPYVDLYGEKLLMTGPGLRNFIKIPNTFVSYVKVGLKIKIGSFTQREEFRTIERVIDQEDGNLLLALSGSDDLARFKLSEKAYARIYRPATVNESSIILIPLDVRSNIANRTEPKADALRRLDKALLDFGVDAKKDETTRGFIISQEGDFEIIYGIPAVRQAVLLNLRTSTNELPFHPEYGVPFADVIGARFIASVDAGAVLGQVVKDTLSSDGRYEAVLLRDIRVTDNSTAVSLVVYIKGVNVPIPLDFVS